MSIFTLKNTFCSTLLCLTLGTAFAQNKQLNLPAGKDNFTSFTAAAKEQDARWARLNNGYQSHPDAGVKPLIQDPTGMVELYARRTETTKYFIDPAKPSAFVLEQSSGAIHYRKDNQWLTIDSRLSKLSNGLLEASHQEEPVGFDLQRKASYIKSVDGTVYFNKWELYGRKNGVDQLLAKADWSSYTAGDNGLYIRNIFPGMDASMRVRKGMIKTSFIINSNQFAGYSDLFFKDNFQANGSSALAFTGANTSSIGNVNYKAGGKNILQISKGIAYTKTSSPEHVGFRELPYNLDNNRLAIRLETSYINDQLSYGAVVVDPVVQTISTLAKASITGSMNCGSITNSCNYTIPVIPPANATLDSIWIKFSMIFPPPLNGSNANFAIVAPGGCGSTTPISGNALFFGPEVITPDSDNPANTTTAGFWNALQTILKPCLIPSPTSCSPAVMPYTLRFWNTFCPANPAGCSDLYVSAGMDFSIRIRGNSIVVPVINRSSASSVPLCQGQSITLTRNRGSIIGPVTYQWLPDNQTTSSITVTPLATTKYTSILTDSCGNTFTDTTTVVVIQPPVTPVVVSPVRICQFDVPTSLASSVTGTNLRWFATATGGVPSTVAPVPPTNTPGTFNYYVSQINSCNVESPRAQIVVIVNAKPSPPGVVSPLRLCQYDSVALTANGQNVRWYLHPTGGGGQSPFIPPTGSTDDSTFYYATQTVNGCESDRTRLLVTVTYKPNGIISATRVTLCQEETDSFYYFGNARPDAVYNWTNPHPATTELSGAGTQGPYIVRFDSAGTYNVTVQVNNRGCLSDIATQPVTVRPSPAVTFDAPDHACVGEIINIALSTISPIIDSFRYDFGDGVIRYGTATGGPYGVVYSSAGQRVITTTAYSRGCPSRISGDTFLVHALPDARFTVTANSGDNTFCTGDSLVLTARETDSNTHFTWTPDNFFATGNLYTSKGFLYKSGYIRLSVTSGFGCKSSDSLYVKTESCCQVFFPNAFSPNGDTHNDVFRPVSRGHHQVKTFRIVNRWGQVVYESQDEVRGWDGTYNGKAQDMGTYYYYLSYRCGEGGGEAPGQQIEEKGEFLLIR